MRPGRGLAAYRQGLERAGLIDVSIECPHAVGDGVHAATIQARRLKPVTDAPTVRRI